MSLRLRVTRSKGTDRATKFATALSVLLGGAACGQLTAPNPDFRPGLALPSNDGGMEQPQKLDGGMDAGTSMDASMPQREDPDLCLEGRTLRLSVNGLEANQDIRVGELFTIRVENTGEIPLIISNIHVMDTEGLMKSFSARTENGEEIRGIRLRPGQSTSLTLALQENTEECETRRVILIVGYQSNEEGCEVSRTAPTRVNAVCVN